MLTSLCYEEAFLKRQYLTSKRLETTCRAGIWRYGPPAMAVKAPVKALLTWSSLPPQPACARSGAPSPEASLRGLEGKVVLRPLVCC